MASNLVATLRPWTAAETHPQLLLECELLPPQSRPSAGIPATADGSAWEATLTLIEQAVCGVHGLPADSPLVISGAECHH